MLEDENDRYRDNHHWFFCPRGHRQRYTGMSETEKLKATVKSCKNDIEFWKTAEGRRSENLKQVELSNRALKGHLTRKKQEAVDGGVQAN